MQCNKISISHQQIKHVREINRSEAPPSKKENKETATKSLLKQTKHDVRSKQRLMKRNRGTTIRTRWKRPEKITCRLVWLMMASAFEFRWYLREFNGDLTKAKPGRSCVISCSCCWKLTMRKTEEPNTKSVIYSYILLFTFLFISYFLLE